MEFVPAVQFVSGEAEFDEDPELGDEPRRVAQAHAKRAVYLPKTALFEKHGGQQTRKNVKIAKPIDLQYRETM